MTTSTGKTASATESSTSGASVGDDEVGAASQRRLGLLQRRGVGGGTRRAHPYDPETLTPAMRPTMIR